MFTTDSGEFAGFRHKAGGTRDYAPYTLLGAGAGWIDFDNDGDLDLYLVQSGESPTTPEPDLLLRNNLAETGRATFSDASSLIDAPPGYGMGVAVGDFDMDGWTDLYVTNYGPNLLLRNAQGQGFVDASERLPRNGKIWSTSAAFADFNGDGATDLYTANYVRYPIDSDKECRLPSGLLEYCGPQVFDDDPDYLFLGTTDGHLVDYSSGLDAYPRAALGVISGRFTNGAGCDFYVANDLDPNSLLSLGAEHAREVAFEYGLAMNFDGKAEAGMGLAAADLNDDGNIDLFVTNMNAETNTVYLSDGRQYLDGSNLQGLGMASVGATGFGTVLHDFNMDGLLDVYVANGRVEAPIRSSESFVAADYQQRDHLLLGRVNGRAEQFESADLDMPPTIGRGVAAGDFDNDGDLDLLVTENRGQPRLLVNQTDPATWFGVRLRSRQTSLPCSSIDTQGTRTIRLGSDGSYLSASDDRVVYPASVELLTITLPDGRTVEIPVQLSKNQYIEINVDEFL